MSDQSNPQSADAAAPQAADTQAGNGTQRKYFKIEDRLDLGMVPSVHNFTGDKLTQFRLQSKACGPLCQSFDSMDDGKIDLEFYYCHRVTMRAAATGEEITPIRCVLFDKSGNCYGFVSDFIARELDNIREIFGDGPYTEPMLLQVAKIKTRKGFNAYAISPQ